MATEILATWRAFDEAIKARDEASAAQAFEALRAADDDSIERLIFELREKEEAAKRRYVDYANRRVEKDLDGQGRPEGELLLLVPFCLQWTGCPHRIVWKIENCKACGKCPMGELRAIAGDAGFALRIAPRAIFAWSYVREMDPAFTLAVACAHELFEGMLRARAYRLYGVMLDLPEGRCRDTHVAVETVREAITRLVGRG